MVRKKRAMMLAKWGLAAFLIVVFPKQSQKSLNAAPAFIHTSPSKLYLASIKANLNPRLLTSLENRLPGFLPLAHQSIVTIIDFTLPSTTKRLWTISLETGEVLFHSLVAHGRNTGVEVAEKFSNTPESYQSSLGFYITDRPYIGKHGKSLRLKGLEQNLNDKAYDRAIVVHGADYVSDSFIEKHGRLGRSHGCPAIPLEMTNDFIDTVKEGSLLFIYHPEYDKTGKSS